MTVLWDVRIRNIIIFELQVQYRVIPRAQGVEYT